MDKPALDKEITTSQMMVNHVIIADIRIILLIKRD